MGEAEKNPQPELAYPEEIAWLAEKQGTPYEPGTARMMTRDVLVAATTGASRQAVDRHQQGTRLIELLTHGAPKTLGCTSIDEYLEVHCGYPPTTAYRYINFAAGATAEEAEQYGLWRCRVGIEIKNAVGCRTLTDLAEREFQLEHEDGEIELVRFAKTTRVSTLEKVLAQLRKPEPKPEPDQPGRALARYYRAMQTTVTEHREKSEALERIKVRAVLYAGDVRVHNAPMSQPDEFAAMAKLCAELAKIPKPRG